MWTRSGTHVFLLGLLAAAALLKVATALEATITVVVPNGTALELPVRLPLPPAGGCDNCTNLMVSEQLAEPGSGTSGWGAAWPELPFMRLGSVPKSRLCASSAGCTKYLYQPYACILL